ncbi:ER membrane protein complex subunit 10 [Fopius arisanus]|uniref:ER membrane protein complex subunit 10 n=1 Tax=Fopius arisanus TaxID=64838 RepID=A0A0C9RIN1_9HYME|nr:PREDICTED: ER membrane protein complex subunit 10 [Fopius arisanus]
MKSLLLSVVLICALSCVIGSELDYDGWLQIRLYHALNDDPVPHFAERGNITVTSIRTGASTIGQMGLQPSQVNSLTKLAQNSRQYRLKAVIKGSSGAETTLYTSVPACHLLGTELEDIITIWLDAGADPVSITQVSPGPCSLDTPTTSMWTSSVQVRYPDGGPIPDTASYIYKLEREKEARERGETKDNRSFFAKYWMYIIPALIFFVLSSATNPEAGGAGNGGQRQ